MASANPSTHTCVEGHVIDDSVRAVFSTVAGTELHTGIIAWIQGQHERALMCLCKYGIDVDTDWLVNYIVQEHGFCTGHVQINITARLAKANLAVWLRIQVILLKNMIVARCAKTGVDLYALAGHTSAYKLVCRDDDGLAVVRTIPILTLRGGGAL